MICNRKEYMIHKNKHILSSQINNYVFGETTYLLSENDISSNK